METIYVKLRKGNGKDRATALEYLCAFDDCPLRKENRCIQLQGLISPRCPYGGFRFNEGPTNRARSYRAWVDGWQAVQENLEGLEGWGKIAYIGDFVYLPYSFMDSTNLPFGQAPLPFQDHSNAFHTSVKPFISRSVFDAEMVVRAALLKPQALLGGTITDYANKVVPGFLLDLQWLDPELFNQAATLEPKLIDMIRNYLPIEISAAWLNENRFIGRVYLDDIPLKLAHGWLECDWQDNGGVQQKTRQKITDQMVTLDIESKDRRGFEKRYLHYVMTTNGKGD